MVARLDIYYAIGGLASLGLGSWQRRESILRIVCSNVVPHATRELDGKALRKPFGRRGA
jgi:hypothetical protein